MLRPLTASIVAFTLSDASMGEKSARASSGDRSTAPAASICNTAPPARWLAALERVLRVDEGIVCLPEQDGAASADGCREATLLDNHGLERQDSLPILVDPRNLDVSAILGLCRSECSIPVVLFTQDSTDSDRCVVGKYSLLAYSDLTDGTKVSYHHQLRHLPDGDAIYFRSGTIRCSETLIEIALGNRPAASLAASKPKETAKLSCFEGNLCICYIGL